MYPAQDTQFLKVQGVGDNFMTIQKKKYFIRDECKLSMCVSV